MFADPNPDATGRERRGLPGVLARDATGPSSDAVSGGWAMTKVMLGILLLAGSAPLAWAAEPQGQDRAFLDKALHDGLAEVELGKLAARQADSDAVKQFGQRMMEDHQQANQTLMDLARQQGSKEASAERDMPKLEPVDEKTLHTLEGLKGRKFDQTYMRDMIRDHEKAVALETLNV